MAFDFQQYYNTTQKDILYGILEAVGGDMTDVVQYFSNGTNDLLYAILQVLLANGGAGGGNGVWTRLPIGKGATSWTVPDTAGNIILRNVMFFTDSDTDFNIGVGTSEGENDICEPGALVIHQPLIFDILKPLAKGTTIYFNGTHDLVSAWVYYMVGFWDQVLFA